MSKIILPKTTSGSGSTLDSSSITVGGVSLSTTISNLIATNTTEDAQLAGCATVAGNNTFTGSNSMSALTIPSAIAVSSSGISLTKLPRLTTTITPTDPKDLVTKGYSDGNLLDIRPLNNTFTGTNTFNTCPQTSASAINNNDIPNKSSVTNIVSTNIGAIVNNAVSQVTNVWTGPNTYNTVLPTSTVTPSHSGDLVTKTYVDSKSNLSTTSTSLTLDNTNGMSYTSGSNIPLQLTSTASTVKVPQTVITSDAPTQIISPNPALTIKNSVNNASVFLANNLYAGNYNNCVQTGDNGIISGGKPLTLTYQSGTGTTSGVRLQDGTITTTAGANSLTVDKTNGLIYNSLDGSGNSISAMTIDSNGLSSFHSNSTTNITQLSVTNSVSNSTVGFITNLTNNGDFGIGTKGDSLIYSTAPLDISFYGAPHTNNGVKIGSQTTTLYGGTNNISVDATNGIVTTGNSTFNTIPTIGNDISGNLLVPSNSNQVVTKSYADGLITLKTSTNNAWTGTNSFNTSLPSSTVTPINSTDLVTKTYSDGLITTLVNGNNTWTGTNSFNTSLPSSTVTPINSTDLVTKSYVDGSTASRSVNYVNTTYTLPYLNSLNQQYYKIVYPYLGTGTTSNSTGTYNQFYINTLQNTSTILTSFIVELYSYMKVNAGATFSATGSGAVTSMTGTSPLSSNINVRQTPFTSSDCTAGTLQPALNTILFAFYNGTFNATVLSSTKNMWTSSSQASVVLSNSYGYGSTSGITTYGTMSYSGLAISYQPANTTNNTTAYNRIMVSVGAPFQQNSPACYGGSVTSLGFTASLQSGFDSTGQNGFFLTVIPSPLQT